MICPLGRLPSAQTLQQYVTCLRGNYKRCFGAVLGRSARSSLQDWTCALHHSSVRLIVTSLQI
jgi:hypothetical protein